MTRLTWQGFPHSANPKTDWKVAFARKEFRCAERLRSTAGWRGAVSPVLAAVAGAALLPCIPARAQEAQKNVIPYLDEQPVSAKHGMVVSVHHLASDAGLEVLREGGNAVDAAVATGFALAVVHPAAGNLGGGGFMLIRTHDGNDTFLDYREKAPLAATETMYQDAHGNVLPEESLEGSVIGYRSIGTPGSVAGMVHAEKKYGKLGLQRVVAPAIKLAADGFVLSAEEAKELTDPDLAKFPDSKRIFQRDGNHYKEGETFKQPELARTLQRIAADPDSFYHGAIAHELVDELHKGGALLTLEDMAQYTVVERTPITGRFHNYMVISAPPPSSGGIVLLTALNILEGFDLAKLGDRSVQSIHLITEAYRRAYMDRADYLGDPDYNPIPMDQLTSKKYADAWRASIDPNAATAVPRSCGPPDFCLPRRRLRASDGRNQTRPRTTRLLTATATRLR
jgi:gamma-glutamyltranspeptidase / glutathione hydrolase